MGAVKITTTPLNGLVLIETDESRDDRGRFSRVFCDTDFAVLRQGIRIAQANHSVTTRRGTIRGMHYQRHPMAEAKLIRCLRGRVLDVAVDIRPQSPTFLKWHGVELSAESRTQVFIPEGFAHGFQALEDNTELLYLHTCPWSPGHEGRLRHDDPRLGIRWPLPLTGISDADASAPLVGDDFAGVQA